MLASNGGREDMSEVLLSSGAMVDQLNRVSECRLSLCSPCTVQGYKMNTYM